MKSLDQFKWSDPSEKIWGFHVHQELPIAEFSRALVIQQECHHFLSKQGIPINAEAAIKPGYGPHLDYMWELRVENVSNNVLEKMGLAIGFMSINRFNLSAYIHPLMQDPSLCEEEALSSEGKDNQANALWFGYRVPQKQEFFFKPPKDNKNRIIDTRTTRIMTDHEKYELLMLGKKELNHQLFSEPDEVIINGFHIHMDFLKPDEALALTVFDRFLVYLLNRDMRPTSTRLYGPRENGPHVNGGWEVKFETKDKTILEKIGIAIAWLMCNRQGLSVFMHPVTWQEGDYDEELKAHKQYSFFLGELPALDLGFFTNKINSRRLSVLST